MKPLFLLILNVQLFHISTGTTTKLQECVEQWPTACLVGVYIYYIINDIHIFLLYFFWASATFTRDYNIIRFWNPSIERCCHLMSVPPMVFKLTQCNLKMAIAIYTSHYIQMPIFLGLSGESPLIFVFSSLLLFPQVNLLFGNGVDGVSPHWPWICGAVDVLQAIQDPKRLEQHLVR